MPRNKEIKKVLVIGSGPIVIGQAAEFDYAGTQACRSLKEEGIEVVLLNSNPATIMTDKDIADRVYIEPLTAEVVEQLILKERPDSVLPTLGGQAALNLAMELEESGFLKRNNVRLIGDHQEGRRQAGVQDYDGEDRRALCGVSGSGKCGRRTSVCGKDRLSGGFASRLYAWRQRRRNRS